MPFSRLVPLLAALTLAAATRTPVPVALSKPHPCQVQGVTGDVLCATYPVWENRERKSGRKIGLNIAIIPALERNKAADPIFMLHGGPGAAATGLAPGFSRFRGFRARHDLVFVDQRGTGGSNPLDCDFYGNPPNLQRIASLSYPLDSVRACRQRLSKIADLAMYTTAPAMDDVDEVRQWLGYGRIDIWGGSYGSDSAQVYLQRHAASVRAVILLGVVPLDELNPLHHAWAAQRVVDMLFEKCRADRECRAAYPNLRAEFQSLFDRVRKGVDVNVRDGQGRVVSVRPSVVAFAEGIRHSLYYDDGRSFPSMIHRAAAGDLSRLLQAGITANLSLTSVLSLGMQLSVTCAEDLPYIDDALLARETANTFLGDLRVQEQRAACHEWVRGPVPPNVHELVRSDVPVLLLSGGRDPVTPPLFAERVARQLPNSLHVVFPEASHGNFADCGNRIMSDFIERGSVKGLDVSCASEQPPMRFLIER